MRRSKSILLALVLVFSVYVVNGQNLFLQENAAIFIQEGVDLQVGGDLENNGMIENMGTISLYANLTNASIFNTALGELSFNGNGVQRLISTNFDINTLTMNGISNELVLESNTIRILNSVEFINGIIKPTETTNFIIESDAEAIGGSQDSYFDGSLIQMGTGFKYYPIGNNGVFTPISMDDIRGINVSLRVSSSAPAAVPVVPNEDDVIGVSDHAIWQINLEDGSLDSILLSMEFEDVDFENFTIQNDINADSKSPVVLQRSADEEFFRTLGVSELTNWDAPFGPSGRIIAEEYLKIPTDDTKFVAIGYAPILSEEGGVYIPTAFSPNAIDEDNKSFKVFGFRVVNQDFELRVFNRFNVLVYETNDFLEANQVGWDGTNQNNGNEEPSGLYYYTIKYKLESGQEINEQRSIYLIR
ncbi:MAG: gliding motility-associated C-terminal domain-containing protein [Bacteroidota bacterium]